MPHGKAGKKRKKRTQRKHDDASRKRHMQAGNGKNMCKPGLAQIFIRLFADATTRACYKGGGDIAVLACNHFLNALRNPHAQRGDPFGKLCRKRL